MNSDPMTVRLVKSQATSYRIKLRWREAWRAWRSGISLPASRVSAEYPFTVGGGGGGEYAGDWTVPVDVTSVRIEVLGGGGEE